MKSGTIDAESALNDLTRLLWQQRRLLERVLYLLRVQELILASGDDAMLAHAVNDIQSTLETVGEIEAARQEITHEIGIAQSLGVNPSLEDLVENAPEPYGEMLADHRNAFHELVADITTVSLNGRAQLERGLNVTRQLSAFVMGDRGDGGYDASGSAVPGSAQRRLIDRAL